VLWKETSLDRVDLDLLWEQYLEGQSEFLQQFHGCLRVSVELERNYILYTYLCLLLRSLNGIGAGPAETAQPTIIADVMFLHDRGKYQTLYFVFYFGSLMVGPIISGPMAQRFGWRNFWWLNTALLGFTVLLCIFAFPETKFTRSFVPENSTVSPSPPLKVGSSEEFEHAQISAVDHADPEKSATAQPKSDNDTTLTHVHTHEDPWLGRGKPSKQQWKLAQPFEGNFFLELWMPWKLFAFPIVEFSSFVVSWTASSFLTLNLTQSQVFAAPPYNFSSSKIGLFNFAVLVGALIGLFTAGPLSDAIAARLTKRNRGIREPEMRLIAMIPYVIIMVIGNIVVAVGYEKSWDWKVSEISTRTKTPHLQKAGNCNHWLYLCRYPSSRIASNFINLFYRLLQTRSRQHLRRHYC
jgi:MFS family permease